MNCVARLKIAALAAAASIALVTAPAGAQSSVYPGHPSPAQLSSGARWAATTPGDSAVYNRDDAFYQPPAQVPDTPGTLIRSKPAPHLLNVLGPSFPGYAQKILYTSTTQAGTPVATSGFVIEPSTKWRGQGPTPTVVFAPGTRGQADACAPSRGIGLTGQVNPANAAIGLNYEIPAYQAFAAAGMRVVVTDYIGLGTPGTHTYLNRLEQGHALIDAARASFALANIAADSPVAFFGYSQGGGAAASAAELAGTYGKGLNVKGTYAGAPPADPMPVMRAVDGSSIMAVLGYSINSFIARDPEKLGPGFDRILNARGKAFLADAKASCIVDSVARWAFTKTSQLTKSGESLYTSVSRDPELVAVLEANRVGNNLPLNAPMRVAISISDDIVPYSQAKQMARDFCASGGRVQMVTIQQPSILPGVGGNHAVPLLTDAVDAYQYLEDRFNGRPAPSNCASL